MYLAITESYSCNQAKTVGVIVRHDSHGLSTFTESKNQFVGCFRKCIDGFEQKCGIVSVDIFFRNIFIFECTRNSCLYCTNVLCCSDKAFSSNSKIVFLACDILDGSSVRISWITSFRSSAETDIHHRFSDITFVISLN